MTTSTLRHRLSASLFAPLLALAICNISYAQCGKSPQLPPTPTSVTMEPWLDSEGTLRFVFTSIMPTGIQVRQGGQQGFHWVHSCTCDTDTDTCEVDDWLEPNSGQDVYLPVNLQDDCRWTEDYDDCYDFYPHDSDCN